MKNGFTILLFLLMVSGFAQQKNFGLTDNGSEVFTADFFVGYDNFGWRYFVTNNTFYKQKNDRNLEYKNLSLGKLTKVDLHNPLRIVLFYENFNTVVMLDNQLNETQRINFSGNTTPIVVAAIGMASQNRLWIYNTLSQQVGLYDFIQQEYRSITVPFTGRMKFYDSDFNYFYWIDDQLNRFACDVYGKVYNYGKVAEFDRFQILNETWYLYSKSGKLYLHDMKENKEISLQIDEKSFESFYATPQNLVIFTTEGITNYKISIP